jgi:hypothetical protein
MRPSSFQKALDSLIGKRKLTVTDGIVECRGVTEEIVTRENLASKKEESQRNRFEKSNEINDSDHDIVHNPESRKHINRDSPGSALRVPTSGTRSVGPSHRSWRPAQALRMTSQYIGGELTLPSGKDDGCRTSEQSLADFAKRRSST